MLSPDSLHDDHFRDLQSALYEGAHPWVPPPGTHQCCSLVRHKPSRSVLNLAGGRILPLDFQHTHDFGRESRCEYKKGNITYQVGSSTRGLPKLN